MATRSMTLELGPYGLRVNGVAPGAVLYKGEEDQFSYDHIPLGRYGTPEDQAKAALFLSSDESAWIIGQVLTVDGGESLALHPWTDK